MANKFVKAVRDPIYAFHYLISKFLPKSFVAVVSGRSLSDNGIYPDVVRKAVYNSKSFNVFRKNPHYRRIVSVNNLIGMQTYKILLERDSLAIEHINRVKKLDQIGSPIRYSYPRVDLVDPNLMRYLKIAYDLNDLFGPLNKKNIVEVGCGFGGQYLVLDEIYEFKSYTLIDIPIVLKLIGKFVESFVVKSKYRLITVNMYDGNSCYDVFVSNYAYSELPKNLRIKYLEEYISKIPSGYIIVNTGEHIYDELVEYVPNAKIINEEPLSHPGNYTIIWGSNKK